MANIGMALRFRPERLPPYQGPPMRGVDWGDVYAGKAPKAHIEAVRKWIDWRANEAGLKGRNRANFGAVLWAAEKAGDTPEARAALEAWGWPPSVPIPSGGARRCVTEAWGTDRFQELINAQRRGEL